MQYLERQVEENGASYQDQVVKQDRMADYKNHVSKINVTAETITDTKNCIGLAAKYISYLKDEHLSISYAKGYFPFASFNDSAAVKAYFKTLPQLMSYESDRSKPVLGVWHFEDGSFSIEIFKHSDVNHDLAGIIYETSNPYWQPGNLRLELKTINDSTFEAIYWRQQLKPMATIAHLSHGKLTVGRLVFYKSPKLNMALGFTLPDKMYFKELSPKTNYIYIPSFDLAYTKSVDSLVNANLKTIQGKPNLIIDLRGNGGGGDAAYYPLLPVVMDNKGITYPMAPSTWVSKANLDWYDETKYNWAENKKDSTDAEKEIASLKESLSNFTPYKFGIDTLDVVYDKPIKVALIVNRGCASSTEGFVLMSKQSKKVKLYGDNTYGALSYGDWRRVDIDGLPVWITLTTKKMNFLKNDKIETTGIAPDINLSAYYYRDWVEIVKKDIEK